MRKRETIEQVLEITKLAPSVNEAEAVLEILVPIWETIHIGRRYYRIDRGGMLITNIYGLYVRWYQWSKKDLKYNFYQSNF